MRVTLCGSYMCCICKSSIEGGYYCDEWGNVACISHKVELCSACERLILKSTNGVRALCDICKATIINSLNERKQEESYGHIVQLLKNIGIKLPLLNTTVSLIPMEMMIKQMNLFSGNVNLGLTLTNKTVFSNIGFNKTVFNHEIYILDNLAELEYKEVLAHEFAHAWLNELEVNMTRRKVEGFCNLISFYVLGQEQNSVAEIMRKGLLSSSDPILWRWITNHERKARCFRLEAIVK